ncbi:MAG: hypothetical protein JW828_16805, partial [Sedimentisphaerales bacterium]|nr:hypothetical protein [Sedimentisphaerales bacterium]
MRSEPGLHKKVSSIFDGVSIPKKPSDSPVNPAGGAGQEPINPPAAHAAPALPVVSRPVAPAVSQSPSQPIPAPRAASEPLPSASAGKDPKTGSGSAAAASAAPEARKKENAPKNVSGGQAIRTNRSVPKHT